MGTELFISHQLSLDVAVKHKRVVDYSPLKLKYLSEPEIKKDLTFWNAEAPKFYRGIRHKKEKGGF